MTIPEPHEPGQRNSHLVAAAAEESARWYGSPHRVSGHREMYAVAAALCRPGNYAGPRLPDEPFTLWQARAALAALDGLSDAIEVT